MLPPLPPRDLGGESMAPHGSAQAPEAFLFVTTPV